MSFQYTKFGPVFENIHQGGLWRKFCRYWQQYISIALYLTLRITHFQKMVKNHQKKDEMMIL